MSQRWGCMPGRGEETKGTPNPPLGQDFFSPLMSPQIGLMILLKSEGGQHFLTPPDGNWSSTGVNA